MKLALWFAAINEEQKHVREESRKPHTYVANAYADVDEEDEEYGSKTDYRWSTVEVLLWKGDGSATVEKKQRPRVVDRIPTVTRTWPQQPIVL